MWLAAVSLGSCASSPRGGDAESTLEVFASDYGRFFQAAVLTLRDAGFQIDRHDYRFGRITTQPLPQATVFEPWRPSSAQATDPVRSTLNFQRLIASVSLEPLAGAEATASVKTAKATLPAARYRLRVQVDIEQLQRPDSYVTGSTRVMARYNRVPAELAERGVAGVYWEAIGQDEKMAHDLLQQILRRSTELPDEPSSDGRAESEAS